MLIHTLKIGVKIAFVYDGFRIFRLIFPHKKLAVSMEDVLYWSYVTVIFFRFLQEQADGVLRGFSVMGVALGMVLYNKLLGERIVALFEKWIEVVKRRLTAMVKVFTIKLCRCKGDSGINGREDGRKKTSKKTSKKKRTKSSCITNGNGSCDISDAGGCGK